MANESLVRHVPGKVDEALVGLAQSDPLRFLHDCREQYVGRGVRDYACTFITEQRVNGSLSPVQEARVRFREEPFSVDMVFTQNATEAQRALFVENAWKDEQGRALAWFKPAGAVIKLFVPKIKQPVDGPRAKAASRRALNEFGFRRTLDVIIKYTERGRENGELQLEFVGEGAIDGRPTYVFERRLPFTGREEPYPDALLRYHIDQEWLVPTGCFSFADSAGTDLLGSYLLTDVEFNVGLSDDDFDPQKIGF